MLNRHRATRQTHSRKVVGRISQRDVSQRLMSQRHNVMAADCDNAPVVTATFSGAVILDWASVRLFASAMLNVPSAADMFSAKDAKSLFAFRVMFPAVMLVVPGP